MKNFSTFGFAMLLLLSTSQVVVAQNSKKKPTISGGNPPTTQQLSVKKPANWSVPAAENPFGMPQMQYGSLPQLNMSAIENNGVKVFRGAEGLPILFVGQGEIAIEANNAQRSTEHQAVQYLQQLHPEAIENPADEFVATRSHTDEQGDLHVRLQQFYRGVEVFGGEVIAHTKNGIFEMLNGRYFPTPTLKNVVPKIDADAAVALALAQLPAEMVKTEWSDAALKLVGGQRHTAQLVIFHKNENFEAEKLAWHLTLFPNVMHRFQFFVDAETGQILEKIDNTCKIDGGRVHQHFCGQAGHDHSSDENVEISTANTPPPPVTGTGLDLLNVNRSFGAWREGSVYYLEDASKPMFNSSASKMPNDPVGVILTLDALNTSPEKSDFNYDIVVSNSTTFNNKAGVSAHWNATVSHDYFRNTFGRNSINGSGGNIVSFVNIVESNGASMGNAFWNGSAMFYGNGDSFFQPLARGLDVGGHEMTHGVVEKTANLVYQNESGALNESFADVFGAMIDRDDWKIGEDVMKPGVAAGGALRSLQDPHNGETSSNSPFWQPKHMNEKYNGSQDNGGVHINSGIVNHAFYLFATNAAVGKDRAEQVYYKALRDYLVKSSKFIDCRVAVIKAATDLYGTAVANAAGTAFDQVGIFGSGGSGGGGNNNYQGNLATNPGKDYVLVTTNDYKKLDLADGTGKVLGTLYNSGVESRPSISDDGSFLVFVNSTGHIIGIDLVYNGQNITPTVSTLSSDPVWRNVAISKNGRFLAGVTKTTEPKIYIFDLLSPQGDYAEFNLYNPTYSGQITLDVKFADVLEFDYSGNYLMYDAYTENTNSSGQKIGYWDINFLQFWKNGFTDGKNAISKLFNGLPPKTSIGNPTFSKNSPYIIAFDVIDELNSKYHIFGANLESGDNSPIVQDIGDLGVPNYNRLDNAIIYEEKYLFFGKDIVRQGVATSKIAAAGNASTFVESHVFGVWFANGTRSLVVDANDLSDFSSQITAFPNPTNDNLHLQFSTKNTTSVRCSIFDVLGKTVFQQNFDVMEGDNILTLPVHNLPSGNYFVQILLEGKLANFKIIKN